MTVRRLAPHATTIFTEVSRLATQFDAINLGQGFPDFDGPASMLQRARQAIAEGANQYPPGAGIPDLRLADIANDALLPEGLARLAALDPASLPLVEGTPQDGLRLGPCVGEVRKFIAIGLN